MFLFLEVSISSRCLLSSLSMKWSFIAAAFRRRDTAQVVRWCISSFISTQVLFPFRSLCAAIVYCFSSLLPQELLHRASYCFQIANCLFTESVKYVLQEKYSQ